MFELTEIRSINLNKIKNKTILVDLDETLIFTNLANNLSYQAAAREIIPSIKLPKVERLTSEFIYKFIIKEKQIVKALILRKNQLYNQYLSLIFKNYKLVRLLENLSLTNSIYLITHSNQERANTLLKHHKLNHLFSKKIFFRIDEYKYPSFIINHNVLIESIYIFDDSEIQLSIARIIGIPQERLFIIK